MSLTRHRRPMTVEETAWLARERGGRFSGVRRTLAHGDPLARRLEERLALDVEAGVLEVLTLEPDASAYVDGEPRGLYLFEATAERQVVLISEAAAIHCEEQGRGQLFASQGPIVIERAPHSGLIYRLQAGRRAGECAVAPGWSPPLVLGCEAVDGSLAALDEAYSRCLDAELTERWPLQPPHVVRYAGTEIEVLPGDKVEMQRWLRAPVPACVLHVPGVSPMRPSRGSTVIVRTAPDEGFYMGCDAAGDAINLRFIARGVPPPDDEP